ncbi:MAG: hypothetical protein US31_C0019G0010 [Berkelbacteria bacterium GW2011_GWA1_36_9]|uniref:Pycsar effector protein domain-containing protein n=1 Tax=Berkelbacteria bacterium GW2011_GWA1_36_9 TaxID=1618331 RepID=A0A0G0FE77_9BACT|nr:MAG: hypothetical protein US31_C0019G0010 [Berkelbacteria bacterium GW2011_GWA1_36_9]
MENEKIDSKNDLASTVKFLGNVLDKTLSQTQHIDNQINILIGIDSGIFLFSTSKLNTDLTPVFFTLGIASVLSLIISLLAVHPPEFIRKSHKQEIEPQSLMKNKQISDFTSATAYGDALIGILGKQDQITQNYAGQIYSLAKYYYRPKREMYKLARNLLLVGMIVSAFLFLYATFAK